MQIETERTLIRSFREEDLFDLYEIFSDEETMRACEPPFSLEKTKEFLESFCIKEQGALACQLKESGKVIGYILFKSLGQAKDEGKEDIYEVGWIYHRNFWRQGYAYESLRGLFKYAFENLAAHKLCAETIDVNKSVALMKKLGMVEEGIQRAHTRNHQGEFTDLHYYGLLRKDDSILE